MSIRTAAARQAAAQQQKQQQQQKHNDSNAAATVEGSDNSSAAPILVASASKPLLPTSGCLPNLIAQYTRSVMKSEFARLDGRLAEDVATVLSGHCIYLQHALCAKSDFSLLRGLMADMEARELSDPAATGMINWSKHYKYDNPDFSPTFRAIVTALGDYFDADIHATRLNFYPDATSWKPFHHDSHAYGLKGVREDFTMGASFGASRELAFLHPSSRQEFSFPQLHGDIFAFDSDVNKRFQHGVPRAHTASTGPRFSVIAWGRRRAITERNGGRPGSAPVENPVNADAEARARRQQEQEDDAAGNNTTVADGYGSDKAGQGAGLQPAYDASGKVNEKGPDITSVAAMVRAFLADQEAKAAAEAVYSGQNEDGGDAAAGNRLRARVIAPSRSKSGGAGADAGAGGAYGHLAELAPTAAGPNDPELSSSNNASSSLSNSNQNNNRTHSNISNSAGNNNNNNNKSKWGPKGNNANSATATANAGGAVDLAQFQAQGKPKGPSKGQHGSYANVLGGGAEPEPYPEQEQAPASTETDAAAEADSSQSQGQSRGWGPKSRVQGGAFGSNSGGGAGASRGGGLGATRGGRGGMRGGASSRPSGGAAAEAGAASASATAPASAAAGGAAAPGGGRAAWGPARATANAAGQQQPQQPQAGAVGSNRSAWGPRK